METNNLNHEIEIWDLYDKDGNTTGLSHVRGVPIPDGYYHLAVHIWIKNAQGQYLIAQRAETKDTNPLKWECQGGSVLKGENSLQGALREVKEEVGIDLNPECGQVVFSKRRDIVNGKRFNDLMDVWVFDYDGEVNLKNATTDEVAAIKWMWPDEITEMFNSGEMVDTLGYFFEKVNK